MESDVTLWRGSCYLLVSVCVCVCACACVCGCANGGLSSFIPLSQHMGKGLQPLIAIETHVCSSLCLPALRTDRQLVVSQPRITHTEMLVCRSHLNTHTRQVGAATARIQGHTRTHTHTQSPSPRQKSLSPTFVNSFVSQQLLAERNSDPQKGQFSAPLALCVELQKACQQGKNINPTKKPSFLELLHCFVFPS